MAPIKFEENIKGKLEKRTIKPSVDAWSKLETKLGKDESIQPRKTYLWLAIAASFIGFLVISIIMLKVTTNTYIEEAPVIVEEDAEANNNIEPVNNKVVDAQESVFEASKDEVVKQRKPNTKKEILVVSTQKASPVIKKQELNKSLAPSVANKESIVAIAKVNQDTPQKSIAELKIDEVVAKIQSMQNSYRGVTDAEIDSLLMQAQNDIISKRFYNTTTKTVNAELLLLDVEEELDQSFRDRVFQALKNSYNKAKTAVAERNN